MADGKRVIVVGSGAAGMSAAVSAARSGASVTVLEKADLLGGTTAFSGGGIWIPGNRWGRAEGVVDSPEDGLRYLCSLGLGDIDLEVAEAFCQQAAPVTEQIEASSLVRWNTLEDCPDYYAQLDGGRVHGRTLEMDSAAIGRDVLDRVRPNPFRSDTTSRRENSRQIDPAELARWRQAGIEARGRGLVGALLLSAMQLGADVRTGVRVTRLLTSGDAVVGVAAGGQELLGQVIIATGGFERDPALVRTFLRGPMTAPASAPTHVGDGLRMGMMAGAGLGNMTEAWWSPAMPLAGRTIDGAQLFWQLTTDAAYPGTIIVDGAGRRFVDESIDKSDLGRTLQDFDAGHYAFHRLPCYLVLDAGRRAAEKVGPLNPSDPDPAWLFKGGSIEQLAQTIGVPERQLGTTVDRYNSHQARGVDDDFGRGSNPFAAYQAGTDVHGQLRPLTEPPFYAVRMELGCLATKGGLKIDRYGRVQKADGSGALAGLYAAGNAAANPFGCAYPGGGGTIGPALVFGWLAGECAASA